MPIKTSGPISMLDLVAEFGGSGSHSLSEYYAGGPWVPSGTPGIPSGGQISLSMFYGASAYQVYNYTLYGYDTSLNIFNRATAAGFVNSAGARPLLANINIYGVLGANHVFDFALITGAGFARTPLINITVHPGGYIVGAGGRWDSRYIRYYEWFSGGWWYTDVPNGGHCMVLQEGSVSINNLHWIAAGGGAGQPGTAGIHGGGSGYVTAPGLRRYDVDSGPPAGGLITGGGFQGDDGKAGNPNGGAGGGWVAGTWPNSTSNDGWGYGISGTNNQIYRGGGAPGSAVVYAGSSVTWINYGNIGGAIGGYTWGFPAYYSPYGPPYNAPGPLYDPNAPTDPGNSGYCLGENSLILTTKGYIPIADLSIGDEVYYETDKVTKVKEIVIDPVGNREMYLLNDLELTSDHLVLTQRGWCCINPERYKNRLNKTLPSETYHIPLDRISLDSIGKLTEDDIIMTINQDQKITKLEKISVSKDYKVFAVVTENGSIVTNNGMIVDAYGVSRTLDSEILKYAYF